MAVRKFLPRCTAFFNRIPVEPVRIRNLNAMHLGKKFLAAIFSVIVYGRPVVCAEEARLKTMIALESRLVIHKSRNPIGTPGIAEVGPK